MAKSLMQQLRAIQRRIDNDIKETMVNDVGSKVLQMGSNRVEVDVYRAYTPKAYLRTGRLKNEWDISFEDNMLRIHNARTDDSTGKYIPKVVETGKGYDVPDRTGRRWGKPRPFMSNLKKEVTKGDFVKAILIAGLRNKGYKI